MTLPFSLRTRIRRAGGCWVASGCISDFSLVCLSITGVLNMACSRVTNHRGLAFRSLIFFCSRLDAAYMESLSSLISYHACLLFCAHCGCVSFHPLRGCTFRSVCALPALAATVYNKLHAWGGRARWWMEAEIGKEAMKSSCTSYFYAWPAWLNG